MFLNDHAILSCNDSINKLTVNDVNHNLLSLVLHTLCYPKVSSLESPDAESILDIRLEKEKRYAFIIKWLSIHC